MSGYLAQSLQLDICDVCEDHVQRRDLVRTQVEYLRFAANNYCIQSKYDASHWVTDDTADLGYISIGPHAGKQRLSLDGGNNLTEVNGVYTITDGKLLRTTVATEDLSSWTSLCFSAWIAPYHRSTTPDLSVAMGTASADGSVKHLQRTWTINTLTRCWWTATISDLQAAGALVSDTAYFYILPTGSNWCGTNFQLEKNVTSPGTFASTAGSTSINATDASGIASRKVCKNCFERVLRKSTRYGYSDETPVDDPVSVFEQEF